MSASTQPRREVAPLGRMLVMQSKSQLLILWRTLAFSLTNLLLPVMFFTFFGLPIVGQVTAAGLNVGAYVLASFATYSVGSIMVYSFGIGVANERGMKVDLLIRATPLPPSVYILGRVVTSLLFALLSLVVLIVYGILVGGIQHDLTVWPHVVVRLLLGSFPFIALGLAIGYLCGPHAAPAVANLVYLPLTLASGFFMPLSQLPAFVRQAAPYLPTYHYAQLAWSAVGAQTEPLYISCLWLASYTVCLFAVAVWAYRREERRKFV